MATWLLPTPGGASTSSTRGARRSSAISASASARPASKRACSGRGVQPAGKCSSRSTLIESGPRYQRTACMMTFMPRQASPRLEFSAGGLVLDPDGRVLLIRARDLRNQPVWTLPKGALKPGESSTEAALREVQEETGYRCEVVREMTSVTYWFQREGRRIRKTVRWYLMRPVEKVGEHDHEVDEVLWAERADAEARLRYDSDRRLLAAVS
ncbi:MAG: hypothetical protein DMD78_00380 [Candidatus Rokuibacteriota bacterium]|nr:MAG: hypothetical protein DMD78_00380 [Candidatus Rokubacteria bacterium]